VLHWSEVARILALGGRFLSQQVGNGSVRELTEAMTGPYDIGKGRLPERAVSHAEAAGLQVLDLQVTVGSSPRDRSRPPRSGS
jgi:hypothetical protein